MFNNIINRIQILSKIRFRFDLPKPREILQLDELYSDSLRKAIKMDFNVISQRKREIYFWIFIRQIIFFDFKSSTYLKNFTKFVQD